RLQGTQMTMQNNRTRSGVSATYCCTIQRIVKICDIGARLLISGCGAGWQPARGCQPRRGRLTIGRSLASCPTRTREEAMKVLVVALLLSSIAWAQDPPPVALTTQQDHQRTMELLGIKEIRRGVNGNDPSAPNAANYDEAKANPHPTLPDPLVLKNGKKVTTAKMWWEQRRAEIVEDFD